MSKKVIVEKTPFLYEDGNTYYFEIISRDSSDYHSLFIYSKKIVKTKSSFLDRILGKHSEDIIYECYNKHNPGLVGISLELDDVKSTIIRLLIANAPGKIKGWDGVVGNIQPEKIKAIKREENLNNLLDD